jgi:GMP synthase (glutamine-hydrolysing)
VNGSVAASRPVLIVLHQEMSTPGRVGHYLHARGIPMDIRRPRLGDPLPETLAMHAGAVIFGGPMSANDPDDFIRAEIEWIKVPLRGEAVSRHLSRRPDARPPARRRSPSIPGNGRGRVLPDPRHGGGAQRTTETWPSVVYQWHREGFDLPAGAGCSPKASLQGQAFRYGPAAYGIQFHAEVTHAMMAAGPPAATAWRCRAPAPRRAFRRPPGHDLAIRTWLFDFLGQ